MTPAAAAIAERLAAVRATIPARVRLIAVTKTFSAEVVRAAYEAGLRDFGENRVQEAIAKQAELSDLSGMTWHLIGRLQSNKSRKALEHFQWIHSIDSLKLAERLNLQAAELDLRPSCCLQLKLRPDPNKGGLTLAELQRDLSDYAQMQHLNITGLMAIPPQGLEPDETQAVFIQTQEIAKMINQMAFPHLKISQLSLGMSADYPLAIAAGSTMIRLGTLLFGQRQRRTGAQN
ncbi:YggS family pyridoxal phosphate-dependent enzyme [Romeria aff. gracilis LEGE 07310]|uniref:Pyridoxal phosphate homeostasis protein n=1 Tax=Vasconcelosia minhoensis LEGE 07310 TaxID=915328 RepID=A0A8J7DM24_9CYAN|nr:YggS family pyridoxal phosphate-dependent enzyme [Romeria gracilis]MBE9078156.1 YggS family pyridoxal phosphate-dependent enzyme [Romeria aff. gracilis LEGE 07310]